MKTWIEMTTINKLLSMSAGCFIVAVPMAFLNNTEPMYVFTGMGFIILVATGIAYAEL